MARKRKKTWKDFDALPTAVWGTTDTGVEPTPFFKNWWQNVAEQKLGNRERWLDAAIKLGYIWKYRDPNTGQV